MIRIRAPRIGGGGGFKTPKIATPRAPMTKIHPAARHDSVRLPSGLVNMSEADPAPFAPGIGKI